METNNKNRHGDGNYGAGRDGNQFNKRSFNSPQRGTRGGNRYESNYEKRGSNDENRRDDTRRFDRNENRTNSYDPNRSGTFRKSFGNDNRYENRSENRYGGNQSDNRYGNRGGNNRFDNRNNNRYDNQGTDNRNTNRDNDRYGNRNENRYGNRNENRSENRYENRGGSNRFDNRNNNRYDNRNNGGKLSFRKPGDSQSKYTESRFDNNDKRDNVVFRKRKSSGTARITREAPIKPEYEQSFMDPTKPIRLNRFLANAGICSRREADEFISAGVISVNGKIISELGTKVLPTDQVIFHNQPVSIEKKVYILLNKPKDFITTAEDTHGRKTVMELVKNACSERVYPVGRLDRNTTGVLLLTNDGELASKLTHPKNLKKKIYHVGLSHDLTAEHYDKILTGIDFDDFSIKADALEFVKDGSLREIGIEIHSGQNRVVRRIFESLGYRITKLDRVYFAGLTKKNVPRGRYRFLSEKEVGFLKMSAGQ